MSQFYSNDLILHYHESPNNDFAYMQYGYTKGSDLKNITLTYTQLDGAQLRPGRGNGMIRIAWDMALAVTSKMRWMYYNLEGGRLKSAEERKLLVFTAEQLFPDFGYTQDAVGEEYELEFYVRNLARNTKTIGTIYAPWSRIAEGTGVYTSLKFHAPSCVSDIYMTHYYFSSVVLETENGEVELPDRFEVPADAFELYVSTIASYMFCKYYLEV